MSDTDPLVSLDLNDWSVLKRELENDWPKSVILYQLILTRLEWEKKEPGKHPFYVYCPGGNVRDGLVTFGKVNGHLHYTSIYTFDGNWKKLKNAIENSDKIEWDAKPTWGVPIDDYPWFIEILIGKGYTSYHDFLTPYYILNNKTADDFKIECPNDIYVSLLKEEDIFTINSEWPHNSEGSHKYLEDIRRLNYGYGVYSKSDNELLSWALKYEYGDIGVLQTKDGHMRKGYAEIVVKTICKRMLEENENVHVHIIHGNIPSERLFLRLGFENVCNIRWVDY